MSLPAGKYEIRSAVNDGFWVGRPLAEDRSLLPKRVVTIPKEQAAPRPWLVESNGENKYILKAAGAPTADIDNKVFAVLLDEPSATEWKLTPVPQHGENAFVVIAPDGARGWVIPEDELFTEIVVQTLIIGPSEPPFYPPSEVFIFDRVEQD